MTTTQFIIVKVMRWGNFDTACTEVALDIVISDDRHDATRDWQSNGFADQMCITLIARIDGDSRITKECLRTGGCDDQIVFAILSG